MKELKTITLYIVGGIMGYMIKDIPVIKAYGFWILPILYMLLEKFDDFVTVHLLLQDLTDGVG